MKATPSMIASLLSRSLGKERADSLVADAAAALELGPPPWASWDATAILERISTEDGLTGIAAVFAKQRLLLQREESIPPARPMQSMRPRTAPESLSPGQAVDRATIVALMVQGASQEASQEVVDAAFASLNITREVVDWDTFLNVLDQIAKSGGTTGTAARFVKTRMVLLS